MIALTNHYADLGAAFALPSPPQLPRDTPKLLRWNDALAKELALPSMTEEERAAFFSGAGPYEKAAPVAMAYAGHQFGNFVPQLGDGRAHLLGEWQDPAGALWDVHLKGSGRTPFSRGGDGQAWLGPVLREYLISEAMAALGIPSTRALAMCSTNRRVIRHDPLPGAVITRIAKSFVRVGSFEYFAARQDKQNLQTLFEFSAQRLGYPDEDPMAFFDHVMERQTDLILKWLNVGFVHGVMNTDNTSLSGETIDYGPCAFLDDYHPQRRFSSIDHGGRYNFMAQPSIIFWNLANLGSCLSVLSDDPDRMAEQLSIRLQTRAKQMQKDVDSVFARKLGLCREEEQDHSLARRYLAMMQDSNSDFTLSFNCLRDGVEVNYSQIENLSEFTAFRRNLEDRWNGQDDDPMVIMAQQNPVRIPRNHRVEAAIEAAVADDFEPFQTLLDAVRIPFADTWDPAFDPPSADAPPYVTYCGT